MDESPIPVHSQGGMLSAEQLQSIFGKAVPQASTGEGSENYLVVGSNAREHAVARRLRASKHCKTLSCFASSNNPGISAICNAYAVGKITDPAGTALVPRRQTTRH